MNKFTATYGGSALDQQNKNFWQTYSNHLKSPTFWAEITKHIVITAVTTIVTLHIAKSISGSVQGRQ